MTSLEPSPKEMPGDFLPSVMESNRSSKVVITKIVRQVASPPQHQAETDQKMGAPSSRGDRQQGAGVRCHQRMLAKETANGQL